MSVDTEPRCQIATTGTRDINTIGKGDSNMSLHSNKHFIMQAERLRLRKVAEPYHQLGFPRNAEPAQAFGKYAGRESWHIAHRSAKYYATRSVDIKPKN